MDQTPPRRKLLPHGIPPWVGSEAIYFITICCQERRTNQLALPPIATALFESIVFRQQRLVWYVHLMLLMPDHVHALISFPPDAPMKKVVSEWKEVVAKKTGIRWQRDFFDHRIRSLESHEEKADYIRQNPVRAALVSTAADWRFVWEPESGGPGGPALPIDPRSVRTPEPDLA